MRPPIPDWIFTHARERPAAPALAAGEARLTYADLAARVRRFAGALQATGAGPGDRVLLAVRNSPAAAVASAAIQLLGGCAVDAGTTAGLGARETILGRAGCRYAIFGGRELLAWGGAQALPFRGLWVVPEGEGAGGAGLAALLPDGTLVGPAAAVEAPVEVDPDAPALVLFTSGSTGLPRGVVLTSRNLEANSRAIAAYLDLRPSDCALLVLPLSYCYGRSVLQTHLLAGGSVVLDDRSRFASTLLATLSVEGCTGFAGVPLNFELLRRTTGLESLHAGRLRYVTQAGGPMSVETTRWARAAFAPAQLVVMYGQTEATARLSYLPPGRAAEKEGSIGIPIPGVTLRVADEDGSELPDGAVGELIARGDNVAAGYLGEPEESARVFRDGWLWTGDLAYRDRDGFFFLAGRAREILKIAGRRVSPVEIEHALLSHPSVADAAITGTADPLAGEVAAAWVVPRPGVRVAAEELQRHCRARLGPERVPRTVRFVVALPRSESGKLLRGALREGLAGEWGQPIVPTPMAKEASRGAAEEDAGLVSAPGVEQR